jgi:hypothetical protein
MSPRTGRRTVPIGIPDEYLETTLPSAVDELARQRDERQGS